MSVVPVLSAEEASVWDRVAREDYAIPSRVLMESAGRAVAAAAAREFAGRIASGVTVVCGEGNNGGDGFVAARALAALGVNVTCIALEGAATPDNAANRSLAQVAGCRIIGLGDEWGPCGLVLDALLGTGAKGAPRATKADAIQKLMRLAVPVVAVDGPTGLDLSDGTVFAPCVRADLTVSFGGFRRGHLLQRSVCGEVVAVEIGFPPPDPRWPCLVTDRWLGEVLPPFRAEMHKGERGRVLVVGGAEGMAGAAIFAAKAAARSGAGLVKICASPGTVQAAQAQSPDLMCVVTALGPDLEEPLAEALAWADAVVLGPGLGRGAERDVFARATLKAARGSVLLDADGLFAFRGAVEELRALLGGRIALLTPHRGEFGALFPDLVPGLRRDPFAAAAEAAGRVGQTVLLKGVPTIIAAPGVPPLVSASGNPGLATGGTGDVLAGMAASWLARGAPGQVAGAAAAHVHGRTAEDVAQHRSVRSLRPDDLLSVVSPLWRSLQEVALTCDPPLLARLAAPSIR